MATLPSKINRTLSRNISVSISPFKTDSQVLDANYPFQFNLNKIRLNISEPIKATAANFISQILEDFVDEDRDLKTLLNLGEDRQNVVLSRRYGPIDATGTRTLQLKLLDPIPDEIGSNETGQPTAVFISTEIANSIIQSSRILDAPPIDRSPFLRPRNTGITVNDEIGKSLKNVTLNVLRLETGSLGGFDESNNISFEDTIFRRWYSYDFNSAELNIDFTNYDNFVLYGSAAMRLHAFRQKLLEIEKLTIDSLQFEGSVFTGSLASAGASYILQQSSKLSKEKEDIIRSFDRYEQYLYFTPSGSNSPYSASFEYVDGEIEFNEIGYWPKQGNGTLFPVNSEESTIWFDTQLQIAQRFDEFNENNLINTIPTHIREDEENAPFFTFVVMIGHFFDTIKPYIDQFPEIYSRYLDPDEELSKDLVTTIADSVGFKMPTIDSVFNLAESVLGTQEIKPRRDFTVESHKRLLHNLPLFTKTKGSRYALRSVLRTLGITEKLIDVQETGISDENSNRVFAELYNAIKFDGSGEVITVPLLTSLRTPSPRSFQINLTIDENKDMTILNGDDLWAINVKKHPTNNKLIKIEFAYNNQILSSRYFDNTTSDLINISLRTYEDTGITKIRVVKVYQEDIIFESEITDQNQFTLLWNITENIYIGGFGLNIIDNFVGTLDEFRLWGINLSDKLTLNSTFDPGSNAGDVFTDASDFLYGQLSFNKIDVELLVESGSLINESPYSEIAEIPSLEEFTATGFTTGSFVRNTRYIKQNLPNIGSISYITNKVRVAPPPVFSGDSISSNGTKILSRTRSIVSLKDKQLSPGLNKVNVSASPTNIINQNIIRNIGLENINQAYGIPNDTYKTLPSKFADLLEHYNKFYYVEVDSNKFIRIIGNTSSIIRQLIDYFIPARANGFTGVVIEPSILERTKIPPVKKIKFYGIGTRRTNNVLENASLFRKDYEATFTLSDKINISEEIISGSILPLDANIPDIIENVSGTLLQLDSTVENVETLASSSFHLFDIQHPTWDVADVLRSFDDINDSQYFVSRELIKKFPGRFVKRKVGIDLEFDQVNKIGFSLGNGLGKEGAEPYGRIYPRKLFEYEINRPRSGGTTSLTRRPLYAIPPSCDLEDFGSRNFFIQKFGVYYFPKKVKKPFYSNPLNATWNMESQEFVGVTKWTLGDRYTINDVVFQDVQLGTDESALLGDDLTRVAKKGNGKFYVFKTRSSYTNTSEADEGVAFYSGSVISTLPPSLDGDNWARIKFSSTIISEPKRVVFDTFIIPDPILNDFRTATVDISRRIDLPERFVDLFFIGGLRGNSRRFGQLSVQNIAALFGVQMNSPSQILPNIRLRLYRSAESRDSDANRLLVTPPEPTAGVLLDIIINEFNSVFITNPILTLISEGTTLDGNLYYIIDNLAPTINEQVNLYLYYFATQIEPRLPRGYLRKHYRYFRDNSTATKRRNFLGCKNTEDTTVDGLPPIQIFLGEGTDATISPTLENTEIQQGAGGVIQ